MSVHLNRGALVLLLLFLSCRAKTPEPPPFDLIATALREFVKVPPTAGTTGSTARAEWIERVISTTALEDAMFAGTGDVYVHYDSPEPAWETLEGGSLWWDYLRPILDRQEREFGPSKAAFSASDTAFLRGDLSVDSLSALLQERIDGFKKTLRERHPPPAPGPGPALKTVWLLSTGDPAEEKRRRSVREFEARFPGRARFITVERKGDPDLFRPIGRRLTSACVVEDLLIKDVSRLDQWVELLVGRDAVPAPARRHPGIPFYDAHEHVPQGGIETFLHMLDLNGATCSVIAALPNNSSYHGGHNSNTRLLEETKTYPGRIIPLVLLSPLSPSPLDDLKGYLAQGARGVKLITGHGDYFPITGIDLDPRPMREAFRHCEEKRIPIMWHVNSHLYGKGFLRILRDFPKLVIVNPHLGGYLGNAPATVRRLLESHPSLHLDFSFGIRPLFARRSFEDMSIKRDEWRQLVIDFADRFLVGTDMSVRKETSLAHANMFFEVYRDFLELEAYDFDFVPQNGHSFLEDVSEHRSGLRGLHLPPDVLRKIYWDNPVRVYGAP